MQRSFLTKSSDFLTVCCNREWKEGQEKSIDLPAANEDHFEIYLQWLYTGHVVTQEDPIEKSMLEATLEERMDALTEPVSTAFSLAVLAHTIGDMEFNNALVDEVSKLGDNSDIGPGTEEMALVYENLPQTSAWRRLLVDLWASSNVSANLFDEHEEFLPEFLCGVIAKMKNSPRGLLSSPRYKDRCSYHEHKEGYTKCTGQ